MGSSSQVENVQQLSQNPVKFRHECTGLADTSITTLKSTFSSSPLNVNKQAVGSDTAAADLEELLWGGSKEQINNFEEDDFNEPLGLGDDVDLDNVAVTNLQDVLGNYNIDWSEIRIFK